MANHPRSVSGLLGPGATYRGDLVFEGRVRIDGTFEGTIRSDDLLEVGQGGHVRGELDVAQALVAGEVDGVLRARERCTLLETAVVRGEVETPWLDVRAGARVQARVSVQREET